MSQAEDLAKQLSSKAGSIRVDSVVVCVADFTPTASRGHGRRNRLLIEGALGYASKSHTPHVIVRSGKDAGAALGTSKGAAHAQGKTIDILRFEAAAGALSALPCSDEASQGHQI